MGMCEYMAIGESESVAGVGVETSVALSLAPLIRICKPHSPSLPLNCIPAQPHIPPHLLSAPPASNPRIYSHPLLLPSPLPTEPPSQSSKPTPKTSHPIHSLPSTTYHLDVLIRSICRAGAHAAFLPGCFLLSSIKGGHYSWARTCKESSLA